MNVYVDNILADASSLHITNNIPGYTANYLYDEVMSNGVLFQGADTVITAGWGLNEFADSVAILGSNWTYGRLTVLSQGSVVFDENIVSRGANTIIKLPGVCMISGMTLELHGIENLEIGILFAGKRTEMPLFNAGFKYKLNVTGKAERTRFGMVYGLKQPSLKSFEVAFQDIDNDKRRAMEQYIDTVQYVRPHLAEPYETGDFQPLWATLTDAGGFTKGKYEFSWDTSLGYMEAK